MLGVSEAVSVVSVLIAIFSIVIAAIVANHNKDKDTKQETREEVERHAALKYQVDLTNKTLTTKLDGIDSGIRDLKADNRQFRSELSKIKDDLRAEIQEVREIALHAQELSEASHRRLNRSGIEKDVGPETKGEKDETLA